MLVWILTLMFGILVSLTFHRNSVIRRLERVRESIRFLCTISARFLLCEALYVLCLCGAIRFCGDENERTKDGRSLGSCCMGFFGCHGSWGTAPHPLFLSCLVRCIYSLYLDVLPCRVVSLVKSAYHLNVLSRFQRSIGVSTRSLRRAISTSGD